jgi:phosphoribosylaminoimidazole carboxylase PurE protein
MRGKPKVAVIMGSESDLPKMARCVQVLSDYAIPYVVRVLSAHRSPDATVRFAREAERRGLRVIVAGAGGAAHLAGAVAAHTHLPVIGVPVDSTPLGGLDALLSTVQMPPGIPVATVGIGSMGAANAGHLAAAILALGDAAVRRRLLAGRAKMASDVAKQADELGPKLAELIRRS